VKAFEPREQRGAKIEADLCVVVDYAVGVRSIDLDESVWAVALGMNSFVSVVEWMGARFALDVPGPGILARRLIEVAVNNERRHQSLVLGFWS
jgi:hypothetical protein